MLFASLAWAQEGLPTLADLQKSKEDRPATVVIQKEVVVPLIANGNVVGKTKVLAGSSATLLDIEGENLKLSVMRGTETVVPYTDTNLLDAAVAVKEARRKKAAEEARQKILEKAAVSTPAPALSVAAPASATPKSDGKTPAVNPKAIEEMKEKFKGLSSPHGTHGILEEAFTLAKSDPKYWTEFWALIEERTLNGTGGVLFAIWGAWGGTGTGGEGCGPLGDLICASSPEVQENSIEALRKLLYRFMKTEGQYAMFFTGAGRTLAQIALKGNAQAKNILFRFIDDEEKSNNKSNGSGSAWRFFDALIASGDTMALRIVEKQGLGVARNTALLTIESAMEKATDEAVKASLEASLKKIGKIKTVTPTKKK